MNIIVDSSSYRNSKRFEIIATTVLELQIKEELKLPGCTYNKEVWCSRVSLELSSN